MQFLLKPMARISDAVRGTVVDEAVYQLTVQGHDGTHLVTPNPVTLDRAALLMGELARVSTSDAMRKAGRMGLVPVADVAL